MPRLPDEILSWILGPALTIPYEYYADTSPVSPFAKPGTESTSAYLVVNKDWLRVATPILYHTIVLRSAGQAQRLTQVLEANPAFGAHIKRLRMEGGYGVAFKIILKHAPHIDSFAFNMNVSQQDRLHEITKCLKNLRPRELILCRAGTTGTQPTQKSLSFGDAICAALREEQWSSLTTIVLPKIRFWEMHSAHDSILYCNLVLALAECQSLTHLRLPYFDLPEDRAHYHIVQDLHPMFYRLFARYRPALERVEITFDWDFPKTTALSNQGKRFAKLVQENSKRAREERRILQRTVEGDNAPFQKIRIYLNGISIKDAIDWVPPQPEAPKKTSLDVATEAATNILRAFTYAYTQGYVLLNGPKAYLHLVQSILKTPTLAYTIHTLTSSLIGLANEPRRLRSYTAKVDPHAFDQLEGPGYQDTVRDELCRAAYLLCPMLKHVVSLDERGEDDFCLPWIAFEAICDVSAWNVETFAPAEVGAPVHANKEEPVDVGVWGAFKVLKSLRWSSGVNFALSETVDHGGLLGTLVELDYNADHRAHGEGESLLAMMWFMDLPALETFTLCSTEPDVEPFLKRHGHKLKTLRLKFNILASKTPMLSLCPNLETLIFYDTMPPDPEFFRSAAPEFQSTLGTGSPDDPLDLDPDSEDDDELASESFVHTSLSKIIIPPYGPDYRSTIESRGTKWKHVFQVDTYRDRFPALREIQVPTIIWPTNEQEIKKSIWARRAEDLLTAQIKLVDEDGVAWIARVKAEKQQKFVSEKGKGKKGSGGKGKKDSGSRKPAKRRRTVVVHTDSEESD